MRRLRNTDFFAKEILEVAAYQFPPFRMKSGPKVVQSCFRFDSSTTSSPFTTITTSGSPIE